MIQNINFCGIFRILPIYLIRYCDNITIMSSIISITIYYYYTIIIMSRID